MEKNFTQVHHFKWDNSVLQRLKTVSKSNINKPVSMEYKKMLDAIEKFDFKLNLDDKRFMFERVDLPKYSKYSKWNLLKDKILKIGDTQT